MTINVMRIADRYAGIPLCWLAGLWLRFSTSRNPSPDNWNTILVMKFFGLGSLLLSTPFLSALKRRLPEVRIVYLTFAANKELLDKLPQPDIKLLIGTSSPGAFVRSTVGAIRTLRGLSVDAVFDLEFFSKFSTLISSISGASVRVGYDLPARWRRMNLSHPVLLDQSTHATRLFAAQLRPFGIPEEQELSITRLRSSSAAAQSMEKKLGLHRNGFTIVTININAGPTSRERRWDRARFVGVALELRSIVPSVRFFFTGTADERGYVNEALGREPGLAPHAVNCAGLLTLDEFIALLERSSLFLTSDSGPMHIAASVGTPLVALFGPESPRFYGPLGDSRVIYKGISCSPCLNIYNAKLFVCPYHARCMSEISTHEVVSAVRQLLPSLSPEPT